MRSKLHTARALLQQRESGQVIVIFAVFVIVLMVLAGSAYDYASIVVDDARLQNAVDSAALAGSNSLSSNAGAANQASVAKTATTRYLNANGVVADAKTNISITVVPFTPPAPTPMPANPVYESITVSATREHSTAFWPLIGINNVTLRGSGGAHAARSMIDVMLSLDMTYSMVMSGSMGAVRQATVAFINQMNPSGDDPSGAMIGLARFAGLKCNYDPASITTQYGFTFYQWFNVNSCSPDRNLLTPLSNDKAKLLAIAGGTSEPGAGACPADDATSKPTSYACPLRHVGWSSTPGYSCAFLGEPTITGCPGFTGTKLPNAFDAVFQDAATNQWTNDGRNLAAGAPPARKVMILMTDGQNEIATPFAPSYSGDENVNYWDDAMVDKAHALEAAGVEVYVVGYFCTNGSGYDSSNSHQGTQNNNPAVDTTKCRSRQAYEPTPSGPHACPSAASLPGNLSPIDQKLIDVSSSRTNSCDHYFPLSKNDQDLTALFAALAGQISRGQLTQ